ncbi:MAG: HlyD family type I secretion periplasmic adaptor subunit [Magnetospirillum sp. WYHS-4]
MPSTKIAAFRPGAIPRNQMRHLSHEAILEEVEPSRLGFWTAGLVLGTMLAGAVWANFLTVATAARTEGEVVPSGAERPVQHLEGGLVGEVLVRDGDLVRQGQVLLRIDPTLRVAELDQVKARFAALTIKAKRLRAFIEGGEPDFSELNGSYGDLIAEARFVLQSTRDRIAGQKTVLENQLRQRQKQVDVQTKRAASLHQQIHLVREAVGMRDDLHKQGYGSRVTLLSSQLELAKVQGALTEAEVSEEQARAAVRETESQVLELDITERGKATEELNAALSELAEVRENVSRLQDRVNRLDLVAPVGGVVHGMKVHSVGAVIEPAQVLMTIVPLDEQVVVEARLDPKDVGHVRIGQPAKVTVKGFDVRRYGMVLGELAQVSPATLMDEKGQPYFKGRIVLKEDVIRDGETTYRVVPGMAVGVDIVTGSQTLLQYLTRPVYVSLVGAFSER